MDSQIGNFSTETHAIRYMYLLLYYFFSLYCRLVPKKLIFPQAKIWRRFWLALPRATGETREILHTRGSSRFSGRLVVRARPRTNLSRTAATAFRAPRCTESALLPCGQP